MLLTNANAIKSSKICPKTINLGNFEIPPKVEIFFQEKMCMKRRQQSMYLPFGYSKQEYFICLFIVLK
jgi:hypothetical protein